jgi:hypothetical protein
MDASVSACVRVAEIVMLIGGLFGLLVGKIRLTKQVALESGRARIASLFFIAPLPIALLVQMLLSARVQAGALLEIDAIIVLFWVDLLLVLGALAGAVAYAVITRPRAV